MQKVQNINGEIYKFHGEIQACCDLKRIIFGEQHIPNVTRGYMMCTQQGSR